MDKQVYIEQGYESRQDYFECLSEEYDIPMDVIESIADMYGPNEDFDGLIIALQDYDFS